jgi:PAS domain S-box-containing protein
MVRERTILELNDAAVAMLGYERAELVGKNSRILFMDDAEYARIGSDLYAELRRHGHCKIESRLRRKDGTPLDILINAAVIEPADPDRGMLFAMTDISDRIRIEHELESRVLALTRPLEQQGETLRLEDLFDLREIQLIQDAFAEATGVASIITDTSGKPITKPSNFCRLCADVIRGTEKGLINCMRSDSTLGASKAAGPTISPCLSGGLWDGGSGIMVGETQIAAWLIGQVLDETCDLEAVRAYAKEIGADQAEFDSALAEVTHMSKDRFGKVCRALDLIARQLSTLAFNNVQQARAIAERKRVELELRAALDEREALYSELKHRVKNSLALIGGLVSLESAHTDNADVRGVMDAMRTRLDSFAVLYELLGGEGNPDAVRVDSYLARIVDSIEESFVRDGRVVFSLDLEPLSIPARMAAPIGLVVMELATNALKYAFPDGRRGTVSVTLAGSGSSLLRCSVADDGVGLPQGFEPARNGGLGMELIGMLVAQLRGRWRVEAGPGTRVFVEVPFEETSGRKT